MNALEETDVKLSDEQALQYLEEGIKRLKLVCDVDKTVLDKVPEEYENARSQLEEQIELISKIAAIAISALYTEVKYGGEGTEEKYREVEALVNRYGALEIMFKCFALSDKDKQEGKEKTTQLQGVIATYFDDAIQELEKELNKTRQKKPYKRKPNLDHIKSLIKANDAITNNLNKFTNSQYLSGEMIEVKTGNKNCYACANVSFDFTDSRLKEITKHMEDPVEVLEKYYRADSDLGIAVTCVYTLVENGYTTITGDMILDLLGMKRTNKVESNRTKGIILNALEKARDTLIFIDTSDDYKLAHPEFIDGTEISKRPIIQCNISANNSVTRSGKVIEDFTLRILTEEGQTPLDAFPTYLYAKSKDQILTLDRVYFNFPFKLKYESRKIAEYLYRRIKQKTDRKAIKLDTLFKELNIDLTARKTEASEKALEEEAKLSKEELEARLKNRAKKNKNNYVVTIEKIMNYWKHPEGSEPLIHSWRWNEGKKITTLYYVENYT